MLCLGENRGSKMNYYSGCAGVGGFDLGIQQAQPSWKCVGACEIEKNARKVYEYHFPGVNLDGDIRKIEQLPNGTDLFCAGIPCQPFSFAGEHRGFEDTRGTIFFDFARLAEISKPRYLFLENVKGLLNHGDGATFQTIISTLDELGYYVEWRMLDSKYFGVPQSRERVFIIGHLGGKSGCEIFPIGEDEAVPAEELRLPEHLFSTLTASDYKGISKQRRNVIAVAWRTRTYRGQPAHLEFRNDGLSNALNHAWKDWMISEGTEVRRLTPLECERLQGFPDNWTSLDGQISDSARYKMLGNAVTVPVIKAIAERITG